MLCVERKERVRKRKREWDGKSELYGFALKVHSCCLQILPKVDVNETACEDFRDFACGKWVAKNVVPKDRSSWNLKQQLQRSRKYRSELIRQGQWITPKVPNHLFCYSCVCVSFLYWQYHCKHKLGNVFNIILLYHWNCLYLFIGVTWIRLSYWDEASIPEGMIAPLLRREKRFVLDTLQSMRIHNNGMDCDDHYVAG